MANNLGLYLHIPFCEKKCPYCDFYSLEGKQDYRRFTDALLLHMEDYSQFTQSRLVDSIFIGGGTPTAVPVSLLAGLVDAAHDYFAVTPDSEITVEVNPATVKPSSLRKLRKAGVNRLSIGAQSVNDAELAALGRLHTSEQFFKTFEMAREAGFDNINIDLMYGIPKQTPDSFSQTIERICSLSPEHLSLYALRIEPDTPFYERSGSLELPDDDTVCDMYLDAIEHVASAGLEQYEISNFAVSGRKCRHNLKYWNCEEYIGLGPGAHSYFNDTRFSFKQDICLYIETLEDIEERRIITDECYEIPREERIGEYVMLQMRLTDGLDTVDFERRFGVEFDDMFGKYLPPYIEGGFIERIEDRYAFTPSGMFVSSYILSAMLDFDSTIIQNIANGSDK